MTYKTIIIGAGPSGLMSAITASKFGKVLLIEKMPRVGLKLLSTGGGRCNLTNKSTTKELVNKFKDKSLYKIFNNFSTQNTEDWFNKRGVETVCEDGFHIFPKSQTAISVLNALLDECKKNGVEIITNCQVNKIIIKDNIAVGVSTKNGDFLGEKIILSTGGKTYTQFGTTGDGYELAKKCDHKITELNPTLGGLHLKNSWVGECSGLVIKGVNFKVESSKQEKIDIKNSGDLLFTHKGISGPVCLDISGEISSLLKTKSEVTAFIDLTPKISQQEWENIINLQKNDGAKKSIKTLLQDYFTKSFCDLLLKEISIENKRILDLSKKEINKIISTIKLFTVTIFATDGYKKSMVTMGGIDTKEIDMNTLESKIIKNLFFTGEVLNVTGPCGGYNLQWAFASGFCAGQTSLCTSL